VVVESLSQIVINIQLQKQDELVINYTTYKINVTVLTVDLKGSSSSINLVTNTSFA